MTAATVLPSRQHRIVSAYLSNPNLTLQNIGDMFGVTRERVRQIVVQYVTDEQRTERFAQSDRPAAVVARLSPDERARLETSGRPVAEIAAMLGMSVNRLRATGWNPGPSRFAQVPTARTRQPDKRMERYADLLAKGRAYHAACPNGVPTLNEFSAWANRTGIDDRHFQVFYNIVAAAGVPVTVFMEQCGFTDPRSGRRRLPTAYRIDKTSAVAAAETVGRFLVHQKSIDRSPTTRAYEVWRESHHGERPVTRATLMKALRRTRWADILESAIYPNPTTAGDPAHD